MEPGNYYGAWKLVNARINKNGKQYLHGINNLRKFLLLFLCLLISYHPSSYSFPLLCLYGKILPFGKLLWLSLRAEVIMKTCSNSYDVKPLLLKHITPKRKYWLRKKRAQPGLWPLTWWKSANTLKILWLTHWRRPYFSTDSRPCLPKVQICLQ